jgi:hypothetical protein
VALYFLDKIMEYDKSKYKEAYISFGYTGIQLFSPNELDEVQLGYAVQPNGKSLAGTKHDDWKNSWLVIGKTTDCGDPIFVDLLSDDLMVFTASHGQGAWEAELIASSYSGFFKVIKEFSKLAMGRSNPRELERNPMTQVEYDAFISFASEAASVLDTYFWELLVSDEEEGIGPEI